MKLKLSPTKILQHCHRPLFLFSLLVVLVSSFAFTNKTIDKPLPGASWHVLIHSRIDMSSNISFIDTPRVNPFARVEVKKISGKIKDVVANDVRVFIINGEKYSAVELARFSKTTIKADEMIVTKLNDKNAISKYGRLAEKGVIEFRNATIAPPLTVTTADAPLYFIDGVLQNINAVNNLDPNNIREIQVSKATRNGTVTIKTKTYIEPHEKNIEGVAFDEKMVEDVKNAKPVVLTPVKDDPKKVFEAVEIDAFFNGGERAWSKFLEQNLNQSVPKDKGSPVGTYTVWTMFIVNTDGTIADIKALSDNGFGMEAEALKLIKKSNGKWAPGVNNGRQVRSYKKQPVTFVIEN